LEPADTNEGPDELVEAIFAEVGRNPQAAAQRTLAYATSEPSAAQFVRKARQLVSLKGRGSHDYKYSSAVLEDFLSVSPAWRAAHLASTVYMLLGATGADNPLVGRTRSALA
jgi:hypothetical protein